MVSVTFSMDDSSKHDMEKFSWVNWSEIARRIFLKGIKKQEMLERLNKLFQNSELTDEDILKLSKKARKGRFNELKSKGWV